MGSIQWTCQRGIAENHLAGECYGMMNTPVDVDIAGEIVVGDGEAESVDAED